MLVIEIGSQKTNPSSFRWSDCATRATAVALVITTWTGDLPSRQRARLSFSLPGCRPAAGRKKPDEVIPKTAARHSEIGAGLLAATAGGIVPGVRVEFGRTRRGSGLGWQVDVAVPAARQ